MNKKYIVQLEGKRIGITYFERADAPMGVVMGKIIFEGIDSPYQLFRNYCKKENIAINEDDPKIGAIFTQSIQELKVFTEDGIEIKGAGATISGFTDEGYEIDVFGIPYPFYNEEFPHHRKAYDNQFK